jgi:hypothetical protein
MSETLALDLVGQEEPKREELSGKKRTGFHAKSQSRKRRGIVEVNVTGNPLAKQIVDVA